MFIIQQFFSMNKVGIEIDPTPWYDSNWDYRMAIDIDDNEVSSELTNFPVYLDLSLLPSDFHTNISATSAQDIRITTSDGVTEVPREVVFYDASIDDGEVWFKGLTLSSTTKTRFYIYYGNAGATEPAANATYGKYNVWGSEYRMVNHFQNSVNDSTSYQLNLTRQGSTSFATSSGYINGGEQQTSTGGASSRQTYRANNANIQVGTGAFTVQYWVKVLSNASGGLVRFGGPNKDGDGTDFYHSVGLTGVLTWNRPVSTAGLTATSIVNLNQWYHILTTRDASGNAYIYVDGALGRSASGTNQDYNNAAQFIIGGVNAWYNNAVVDEFRWIHGYKSAAEVSAEYSNQSDTSTFYTIGSQESKP
jgi:hypothetical protein